MKKLLTLTTIAVFTAAAAHAQPITQTPLQQYLYDQTGYAPPLWTPAPAAATTQSYTTAYVVPAPAPQADYGVPAQTDVGPSSEDSSLRGLLTSAGN